MKNVTEKQIEQAMAASGKTHFHYRECGICHSPMHYVLKEGKVFHDSNCECTTHESPLEPRSFWDLASLINRQTNSGTRMRLMRVFFVDKALKFEPNYDVSCSNCDASPTVNESHLCGPCFFGDGDCHDPDEW